MKEWIQKQFCSPSQSIKQVIRTITNANIGVALIVDENAKLLGIASDSDIRRAILRDVNLDSPISEVMNKKPFTLPEGLSNEEQIKLLKEKKINRAPVVDSNGFVKDLAVLFMLQNASLKDSASPIDFTLNIPKDSSKRKKVAVIGAAGYIGSILCRMLLEKGYAVRGLDRFMFGDDSISEITNHPNFEIVRGDMRNLDVLVDVAFGVDAVINLAAIVGDPACDLDTNHTIMINYFSAKAAADAARHLKVDRYLFASTAAVYGASTGNERLTEDAPKAPVSLYAETKLKSEAGILSLMDENFSPCIFRLGTVYGLSPRMRFDLVVNLFALHAFTKKKITVFGGTQWRPYVHCYDIARAMVMALEAPKAKIHGQIFNLGSNDLNLRVIDLANKVAAIIPGTEVVHQAEAADQRDYNVSFDKIRNTLGFTAEYNIEKAVTEIYKAFERGEFKDFTDKKYSNVRQQEHLIFG